MVRNMISKIGWKTVGGIEVASSRLRGFIPCNYLKENGWYCEIFNPKNWEEYDLIIFQKAYGEEDINLASRLKQSKKKVVFDLCDNHFAYPQDTSSDTERIFRLNAMINMADAVSVSTFEITKLIKHHSIHIIDDAIDIPPNNIVLQNFHRVRKLFSGNIKRLNLVWFGNAGLSYPAFGMIDLHKVIPILESVNEKLPLTLSVISNSRTLFEKYVGKPSFPVFYYPWDRSTFSSILMIHDICMIPINLNPFTICKTNNRLVLSLILGVPVIADEIPSYSEFKDFVLFSDWQNNLFEYAYNPKIRNRHISEGQKYIKSKYTKEHIVKQWSDLLYSIF